MISLLIIGFLHNLILKQYLGIKKLFSYPYLTLWVIQYGYFCFAVTNILKYNEIIYYILEYVKLGTAILFISSILLKKTSKAIFLFSISFLIISIIDIIFYIFPIVYGESVIFLRLIPQIIISYIYYLELQKHMFIDDEIIDN
jgi:hypothetical protein